MLIVIIVFVAQIQGIYSRQPGAVRRSLLGTCSSVPEESPKVVHVIRLVVQQNVNSSDPTPPEPFLVKIPSAGTLLDIVRSRKVNLPPGIWIDDVTVHVDGHHFTGKDLGLIHIRHLSLTGTFNSHGPIRRIFNCYFVFSVIQIIRKEHLETKRIRNLKSIFLEECVVSTLSRKAGALS